MSNSTYRPLSDADKIDLLGTYAPYIWLAKPEGNPPHAYYPSSVEYHFEHMVRVKQDDEKYRLVTKEKLPEPSSRLPFFEGENPAEHPVPIYAYFVDRGYVKSLVYFMFYPYNRGKEVLDTIWGNHVGDWEHISIDLKIGPNDVFIPYQISLSQHSGGQLLPWGQAPLCYEGKRPIVYSAWGSHANYPEEKNYIYQEIPELIDRCSKGVMWDTQQYLIAYDFNHCRVLENNYNESKTWPTWMGADFEQPGPHPTDPTSGPIWRWGNYKDGCWFGQCRLEDGPTGPISKGVLRIDQRVPNVGMSSGPGVAVYQDRLFCLHQGSETNGELWCTTFDGHGWAADQRVPNVGMSGGPGVVVYQDRLFCFHQGSENNGELWYTTFDGHGWAADQRVPNVGMSSGPGVAVYQDRLFCFHQGFADNGELWYTTFDGHGWAADQQVPTVEIHGSAAVAVYQDGLFCFHQGGQHNEELWYVIWLSPLMTAVC